MDKKQINKKNALIIAIIPMLLALFLIIYNLVGLILLNTTDTTLKNINEQDIKSGTYIKGELNGELVMSYMKVTSKIKGGLFNMGDKYYYVTSYGSQDNKYISFTADKDMEKKLSEYDDTVMIPQDGTKITFKGRIKKLEPYAVSGLRDGWKTMAMTKDNEIVDSLMNYYYIDTGMEKAFIIKIITGILIAAATVMLFLYKLCEDKKAKKSRILAYISVALLLMIIIIVFMNSTVIFTL